MFHILRIQTKKEKSYIIKSGQSVKYKYKVYKPLVETGFSSLLHQYVCYLIKLQNEQSKSCRLQVAYKKTSAVFHFGKYLFKIIPCKINFMMMMDGNFFYFYYFYFFSTIVYYFCSMLMCFRLDSTFSYFLD